MLLVHIWYFAWGHNQLNRLNGIQMKITTASAGTASIVELPAWIASRIGLVIDKCDDAFTMIFASDINLIPRVTLEVNLLSPIL